MIDFETLKNELVKNKKLIHQFNNGYDALLFSNYLNNNSIHHIKHTIKCYPNITQFTIIEG